MSFADEVRAELYAIPVKKPCCRRALAAGLLLGELEIPAGTPDGKTEFITPLLTQSEIDRILPALPGKRGSALRLL